VIPWESRTPPVLLKKSALPNGTALFVVFLPGGD
jgi:hypothetical protein